MKENDGCSLDIIEAFSPTGGKVLPSFGSLEGEVIDVEGSKIAKVEEVNLIDYLFAELRERIRKQSEARREAIKASKYRFYEAHREEILASKRRYHEAHREEIAERKHRRYLARRQEL